jgi:hypothetical protein
MPHIDRRSAGLRRADPAFDKLTLRQAHASASSRFGKLSVTNSPVTAILARRPRSLSPATNSVSFELVEAVSLFDSARCSWRDRQSEKDEHRTIQAQNIFVV